MKKKVKSKFKVINARAAGIDVGSTFHYVAISEEMASEPVRKFESFTQDLHALASWLKECGVETIAMESTGIYWVQLYLILEEYGFEVLLVNAYHIKNISGRKSDVSDCQWIQQLHSYGLLRGSFQPESLTRSLRGYMRHRKNLTQHYSTHVLHMQKAFEQMNIKLHNVLTDITGKSGQLMIQAILEGERNADTLAGLADSKVKSSREELIKSLEGIWKEEPLFELKQSYELFLIYKQKIAECDQAIEQTVQQYNPDIDSSEYKNLPRKVYSKNRLNFNATPHLKDMVGVDLTEIFGISELNAFEIISEVGMDMTKWPTAKHFTSWLNLSPNNRISGGKLLAHKRQKKINRAAQAFKMAAFSLQRSNHWLGDFYRRMKARSGPLMATKATARKLAVIFYHMMSKKIEFQPIGIEEYQTELKEKKLRYLTKQASKLGMVLSPV